MLVEQIDQELDFRGGRRAFEAEMHVFDGAQQIGVARHEHGREGAQAWREDRRCQQPYDALHQPGLAREGKMVGRVVRLDKKQRSLHAHQAQFAPGYFAQRAANHQKSRRLGVIRQRLFDLIIGGLLIRREVLEQQIGDRLPGRQQVAAVA